MHIGLANIVFIVVLAAAIFIFARRLGQIRGNINLGRDKDISDRKAERWKTMMMVAMGQSKMVVRPVAGIMHILIYVGFIIINIEVIEIIIDGIFGTHRILSFMGGFYDFLIGSFEYLAALVVLACVVFLIRRNIMHIRRFRLPEMKGWPKNDANLILVIELLLMWAFLSMNATDYLLQGRGVEHYAEAGSFPISSLLAPLFEGMSDGSLIAYERGAWWFHIVGILAFLNYVPFSKHLHIMFAFPNTYYSNLEPKGKFSNDENVTKEVKLMMDPSADPFAGGEPEGELPSFGAKDVTDLTWKNIMDAYSCTECGRCSSVCPANITGKKLSPRKIMMDTRDRAEELGALKRKNGADYTDDNTLLSDKFITDEEVWACTTCNACTDACPINIDPLNIIVELRRNLVMEQSKMPSELTNMTNNVQNNAAPWAFAQSDRLNWKDEA